jgi:hypothetical protein
VDGEGARFENRVALELKAWAELCKDATGDAFALHYLRTRERTETDFLIVRNNVPWLLLEAKLSGSGVERHYYRHSDMLGSPPVVQLAKEPNVLKVPDRKTCIVSAGFFSAERGPGRKGTPLDVPRTSDPSTPCCESKLMLWSAFRTACGQLKRRLPRAFMKETRAHWSSSKPIVLKKSIVWSPRSQARNESLRVGY